MAVKNDRNLKSQGRRILDIANRWEEENLDWDADCTIVSQYYSGAVMEDAEDQDTLGLVDHANLMIGRKALVAAREETLAAFLKPKELISFKLRDFDGTPTEKEFQSRELTRIIDEHVRKHDPMVMDEIERTVDRQVAHGDALMFLPPRGEGWRPYSGKILTERDAPQNPSDDNFNRWAIKADLQIGDALSSIANDQVYWESGAEDYIRDLWERRYDIADNKNPSEAAYVSTFDSAMDLIYAHDSSEWLNHGDVGHNLWEFYNSRFLVYYFYQKDFSQPDSTPVDLYIVARVQSRQKAEDDFYDSDPLLYTQKAAYPSVENALIPFVLDSNIGVDSPSWGTIKGLGHINYQSDRWTNLLLSSIVNNAIDQNTPLLEVEDHADVKMLEKFIKDGYRANSIIPAGANFVDKSKQGVNVGEALNMLGFLQNQSNANASSTLGQSEGNSGELRVQALGRQQNDIKAASNRGELMNRRIRALCTEVGFRLLEDLRSPMFTGREGAGMDRLKEDLKEAGVKMAWIHPDNVDIDYSRLVGDGDPQVRRQISQELIANIGLIPAEKRNMVLSEWFAATTGDWQKAEDLYREEDSPSPNQQALAMSKASDMLQIGQPFPVTKEDVPETQIPIFLQIGQNLVDQAVQAGQFDSEKTIAGLTAMAQHAMLLVQVLEQRGQRDLAKSFMNEIQRITTEAAGPINNFRQAQEAQQDPQMQIERQKMQLAVAKEQRETLSTQHKISKDTAQIEGKTRQQGFNEVIQGRRLLNEEERLDLEKQKAAQQASEKAQDRFDKQNAGNQP